MLVVSRVALGAAALLTVLFDPRVFFGGGGGGGGFISFDSWFHAGMPEEARRYAALARKFWSKASPQHLDAEWSWIRSLGAGEKTSKR